MNKGARILLVEDDTSLGLILSDQLRSDGYQVSLCSDGGEGFQRFNESEFHMCILDVMMPKMDGFTLAKNIRKVNANIPILFLTAKSNDEDKVEGFRSGGDDYLTKPFNAEELTLRVGALLRRVNIHQQPDEDSSLIEIASYIFDTENYTLKHPSFNKVLTKKEAQILHMLCKMINQVVPRSVILNAVWGQDDYFIGRSLDVFVTKLRKYLAEDDRIEIQNIHSVGFKLKVADLPAQTASTI